jgi:AcrR family transcriptional regulator
MSSAERRGFIPRKRQERGARRVDAIVAAAAALFAERGFDGTSMNAIAKASGMTIGSLYQYFPNRDAVVDAVAESYLAAWRAEKDAALAVLPARASLHEFVRHGVSSLFDFHTKYAGVKAFLDADPRRAESIRTIHEEVAVFAPVFGRWYPDQPYDELARVVFVVSSIIRGSTGALPAADALGKRAEFADDITLAVEQYIRSRLGPPLEPATQRSRVRDSHRRNTNERP